MRKHIFLIWILLIVSVISFTTLRQVSARQNWEVGWPDLPGIMDSPTTVSAAGEKLTLGYIITYIFTFALLIVGVIALLMLIINAVRYMASTAMPAGKAKAIEEIRNIGLGLLLLMGAYIILNTINPELLLFGVEEAGISGIISALGSITLYVETDPANCPPDCCSEQTLPGAEPDRELQLYSDADLQDNPGWNDEATHFRISDGLIARVCANRIFGSCNIYVGDGTTCYNTATEGFNPGAPSGITSAKGEGAKDYVRLILFENSNQQGESQVFSDSVPCRAVTGTFTGDSYCLYRELGPTPPAQVYEAILCQESNWNLCTGEINPGAGALTCNNQPNITSTCVYQQNSPSGCVGAFLRGGGNTDFVPYTYTSCKNLTGGVIGRNWEMVGDNCRVTINDNVDCQGGGVTREGDNGDTGGPDNGGSAIGGIIGF